MHVCALCPDARAKSHRTDHAVHQGGGRSGRADNPREGRSLLALVASLINGFRPRCPCHPRWPRLGGPLCYVREDTNLLIGLPDRPSPACQISEFSVYFYFSHPHVDLQLQGPVSHVNCTYTFYHSPEGAAMGIFMTKKWKSCSQISVLISTGR